MDDCQRPSGGGLTVERRLSAVLAADVVGYSRMMSQDEAGTLVSVQAHFNNVVLPAIERHGGRLINIMGDGILAHFPSAIAATECGVAIQRSMQERNRHTSPKSPIVFRMGINLGDIIISAEGVHGHHINIAARLEQAARPGTINVSQAVYDAIKDKTTYKIRELGAQAMKNIDEPVVVYEVAVLPGDELDGIAQDAEEVLTSGPEAELDKTYPEHGRPKVIVLPFRNQTGDETMMWYCDGVTEEVTSELSRFSSFGMLASNSAFLYRDSWPRPEFLLREFGTQYVVAGSIRRHGDHLRISAQLIDARSGLNLWAERFDSPTQDPFAGQDELVKQVVAQLGLRLDAAERELLQRERKPGPNLNAYEAYLKGVNTFTFESREGLDESRAWFERAIELDPGFARAWGYLAYCEARSVMCGWRDASELADAEAAARRAVELAPDDYSVHWDLAFVHLNRGEFERALSEYDRAYQLNRNDPDLLCEMAEMKIYLGLAEEAVPLIRAAMKLNPYFPDWYRWNLGWALFNAKRYDEALQEYGRMFKPPIDIHLSVAAALVRAGKQTEAEVAVKRFLNLVERPYTIEDARRRVRFRFERDEDTWLETLRLAGLQDEPAARVLEAGQV
jgi:class 3 adenylate cyclase/TolB-like protein